MRSGSDLRIALRRIGSAYLLLAVLPVSVFADPMKPLSGFPVPAVQDTVASPSVGGADTVELRNRLSATRRDSAGRWEALIGVQWLRAGDRFEGAPVHSVGANEVVLLRGGQRETLFLLPPLRPSRVPATHPAPADAKLRAPRGSIPAS